MTAGGAMALKTRTRRVDMRGTLLWFGRRFEVPEACLRGSTVTATGLLDGDELTVEAALLGGKPCFARMAVDPGPLSGQISPRTVSQ